MKAEVIDVRRKKEEGRGPRYRRQKPPIDYSYTYLSIFIEFFACVTSIFTSDRGPVLCRAKRQSRARVTAKALLNRYHLQNLVGFSL